MEPFLGNSEAMMGGQPGLFWAADVIAARATIAAEARIRHIPVRAIVRNIGRETLMKSSIFSDTLVSPILRVKPGATSHIGGRSSSENLRMGRGIWQHHGLEEYPLLKGYLDIRVNFCCWLSYDENYFIERSAVRLLSVLEPFRIYSFRFEKGRPFVQTVAGSACSFTSTQGIVLVGLLVGSDHDKVFSLFIIAEFSVGIIGLGCNLRPEKMHLSLFFFFNESIA
jgi:hypothetical protein